MAKLSKEQIEAAEEAYMSAFSGSKSCRGDALLAAAPHLQYPLDEATDDEVEAAGRDYAARSLTGHHSGIRNALNRFIDRRNAALAPKPTRREQIVASIRAMESLGISIDMAADRIEALYKEEK